MLERLLRSKAEVAVLGIVLFTSGLHLREIARRAGIAPSEAKRELDSLASVGLVKKTAKGNLSVFELSKECPFLDDIRNLYIKTEGAIPLLKSGLEKLTGARWAFVYGSFASREIKPTSDVDVLVIGGLDENELDRACFEVQKKTGREINYILWREKDFEKKLEEQRAFLSSVLKAKKIWLAGDENEFKRIVEKTGNHQGRARPQ